MATRQLHHGMRYGKWLLLLVIIVTGCDTRVQEPWVQDESYLQQERSRAPELAGQLDRRIQGQNDR